MEKTQREKVVEKLEADGHVSNFWAIENYILRLGAIICQLRKDGMFFRSEYQEGTKNYTYYWLKTNGLKI